MTDYPMIYSAPMIRALRAGIKTQTRRIISPGNSLFNGGRWSALHKQQEWDWDRAWVDGGPSPMGNPGPYLKLPWKAGDDDFAGSVHRIYPVIQPGDRIWVKEAAAWVSRCGWRYRADNDDLSEQREQGEVGRWRSPIHMPRSASRITLTVTEVRPQRVSEISEDDAKAEGVRPAFSYPGWDDVSSVPKYRWGFHEIWSTIHGPDAWARNDWVWAYSFSVHHGNIDSIGDRG
jgi:hypothetical protein